MLEKTQRPKNQSQCSKTKVKNKFASAKKPVESQNSFLSRKKHRTSAKLQSPNMTK